MFNVTRYTSVLENLLCLEYDDEFITPFVSDLLFNHYTAFKLGFGGGAERCSIYLLLTHYFFHVDTILDNQLGG
jgi:hypothetical protein